MNLGGSHSRFEVKWYGFGLRRWSPRYTITCLSALHLHCICIFWKQRCQFSAIANNIVNAIENSHQTILILTPSYVQSGWARYEYQLAQWEMLNGQHKIIPVFLEDPADIHIDDKNICHIVKSVTYIVWPGKGCDKKLTEFWENLRMAILQTIREQPPLKRRPDVTTHWGRRWHNTSKN